MYHHDKIYQDAVKTRDKYINSGILTDKKKKIPLEYLLANNTIVRIESKYWKGITEHDIKSAIRGSALPLSDYTISTEYHDLIINSLFLPNISKVRINKLIKSNRVIAGKMPLEIGGYNILVEPCKQGNIPTGTYIDSTNYFNIELVKHKRKKEPLPKKYQEVITRDKKGTIKRKTKIEKQAYLEITVLKRKHKKTPLITSTVKNDISYRNYKQLSIIFRYLYSISVPDMYQEVNKKKIICNNCKKFNTLKTLERKLACSRCGNMAYYDDITPFTVTDYKVQYFFINVFTRYKLDTWQGTVSKQVETETGWKTIYKGKV
jgi:hypothetical protein